MGLPQRGIYFFFKIEEYRKNNDQLRVVRVGTHAVSSGSKSKLWQRLRTHRGSTSGANSGGGNHRGSIFRLHVGNAIIQRDTETHYPYWGDGNSATKDIRDSEISMEKKVSEYIRSLLFLWVNVDDEPSKDSHRALIEKNSIALLAGKDGQSPLDMPSDRWLGNYSNREKIQKSGLWNLNHVGAPEKNEEYDPSFLTLLSKYSDKT